MGRPGTLLPGDRYRLIELLGRGSFGEVWKAHDLHRGQEVAFKFLAGTEHRKAWREATLLTTLNSPHILKINNADLIGDVPFIDTKLARASVDKLCFPLGMEPHRAVESMRRVLRALALCHSVQLVHRDVKPGNVFEDLNGDVVLGDFGIAQLVGPDGSVPRGGDPRIVAPEGWATGSLTFQSDVYSAAVTLYVLLTGRWPFNQAAQSDLEAAVAKGDYVPVRDLAPNVSMALDLVLRKGLAVSTSDRFTTAAEFDLALGNLPRRANRIEPVPAHPGHERCWQVRGGKGRDACVVLRPTPTIEIRHAESGRRVAGTPDVATTAGSLAKDLRRAFDNLRQ